MKRSVARERMARRARVIQAVGEGQLGQDDRGPRMSEEDQKTMQLQRHAGAFLRDHAELRRTFQTHDFERDLPTARDMNEVAR